MVWSIVDFIKHYYARLDSWSTFTYLSKKMFIFPIISGCCCTMFDPTYKIKFILSGLTSSNDVLCAYLPMYLPFDPPVWQAISYHQT